MESKMDKISYCNVNKRYQHDKQAYIKARIKRALTQVASAHHNIQSPFFYHI